MIRLITIVLVIISFSSPVPAQPGAIALFADSSGTSCNLYDQVPGLVTVYVFHQNTPGATACQFKVEKQSGVTLTFLAEFAPAPYIDIGRSEEGIAIAYGGCYAGPNHVLTIQYFGSATSAVCSRIEVVPDPTATPPGIYVTDCEDPPNLLTATGVGLVVNPDAGCACSPFLFHDVTVTTDPEGFDIMVDDTTYTSPQVFHWLEGSLHQIAAELSHQVDDTFYVFSHWSDGGAILHDIIVPGMDTVYTATYTSIPAAAVIDSIVDVPEDQGGWVRMYFQRSGYDVPGESVYPIDAYNIWQRLDDVAIARAVLSAEQSARIDDSFGVPLVEWNGRRFLISSPARPAGDFPPGVWEVVGSFAAAQQEQYIYRAPTVKDSSTSGIPYSVYAVSAHTTTPSVWFMSLPDSGYSVDNLAPAVPGGLGGHYDGYPDYLTLEWDPNTEADIWGYNIYIGEGEDFVPSQDNLEATSQESMVTGLPIFPVDPWHFKVSAVDVHGNESGYAVLAPEYIIIPTFVASHQSAWTGKAVEVNWTMTDAPSEISFRTYRKESNAGEYKETLFDIARDGNDFGFLDKSTRPNENYVYQITVRNGDREDLLFETAITTPSLKLALQQNFPNPFKMSTTIPFDLPEEMRVEVTVYDIAGRKVRTLLNATKTPGSHEVPFDGKGLASGIYFYQLKAGNKTFTKKLVLTK